MLCRNKSHLPFVRFWDVLLGQGFIFVYTNGASSQSRYVDIYHLPFWREVQSHFRNSYYDKWMVILTIIQLPHPPTTTRVRAQQKLSPQPRLQQRNNQLKISNNVQCSQQTLHYRLRSKEKFLNTLNLLTVQLDNANLSDSTNKEYTRNFFFKYLIGEATTHVYFLPKCWSYFPGVVFCSHLVLHSPPWINSS